MLSRYCALSFAAWGRFHPAVGKIFHLFSPVSTPANIVPCRLARWR